VTYDTIAAFAQQGGTIYFMLIFVAGVVYALQPKKKAEFDRAARMPLEGED
jgi:cytochrome c oxidase cbb3-type subunit 4